MAFVTQMRSSATFTPKDLLQVVCSKSLCAGVTCLQQAWTRQRETEGKSPLRQYFGQWLSVEKKKRALLLQNASKVYVISNQRPLTRAARRQRG